MSNYICPHCGKSDYYEQYSMATTIYSPPHYKNGILIDDDPNYYTTYCRCAACGKEFTARENRGHITIDPVSDSSEASIKKVDVLLGSITI